MQVYNIKACLSEDYKIVLDLIPDYFRLPLFEILFYFCSILQIMSQEECLKGDVKKCMSDILSGVLALNKVCCNRLLLAFFSNIGCHKKIRCKM